MHGMNEMRHSFSHLFELCYQSFANFSLKAVILTWHPPIYWTAMAQKDSGVSQDCSHKGASTDNKFKPVIWSTTTIYSKSSLVRPPLIRKFGQFGSSDWRHQMYPYFYGSEFKHPLTPTKFDADLLIWIPWWLLSSPCHAKGGSMTHSCRKGPYVKLFLFSDNFRMCSWLFHFWSGPHHTYENIMGSTPQLMYPCLWRKMTDLGTPWHRIAISRGMEPSVFTRIFFLLLLHWCWEEEEWAPLPSTSWQNEMASGLSTRIL